MKLMIYVVTPRTTISKIAEKHKSTRDQNVWDVAKQCLEGHLYLFAYVRSKNLKSIWVFILKKQTKRKMNLNFIEGRKE